jgi:hypothetical protein
MNPLFAAFCAATTRAANGISILANNCPLILVLIVILGSSLSANAFPQSPVFRENKKRLIEIHRFDYMRRGRKDG